MLQLQTSINRVRKLEGAIYWSWTSSNIGRPGCCGEASANARLFPQSPAPIRKLSDLLVPRAKLARHLAAIYEKRHPSNI